MKNLTLKNIAIACNGKLYGGYEDLEVEGVVSDSRQVEENYLFLAIKGERVDGHKFIPQIMEKGGIALCEEAPENPSRPYIIVEDVLKALQDIAEFYRRGLSIPIVGITGSVGKTSTKECIASVISRKYQVLKTEGNFNNEIGVPLTLLRIRDCHQVAVLEMGINHFGEMHRLSRMVKPDIVVMTNIGECHLEFLGSRDGILKAKSEIFDYLQENGSVFINGDDDKLITIGEIKGKKPTTFGLSKDCQLKAIETKSLGLFGTKMKIQTPKGCFEAQIPLPGNHMVYNALAATAVGECLQLTKQEIIAGIGDVKPTGGRSNVIQTADKVVIDDCYNANPVSMCAAIDLLCLADTRKVAILGDMFELGENSKKMHGNVGQYAVETGVDVLICTGEDSEEMANAAKTANTEGHCTIHYYKTKAEMLEKLPTILQSNDTILVKASHGMGFAEVVELLK